MSRLTAWLGGARRRDIVASFATVGPNIAWMTRRVGALRAIVLIYSLLHDDRRILDRLDFHPGFSATDDPLRQFAEIINWMRLA
jgi:hypothetical protein